MQDTNAPPIYSAHALKASVYGDCPVKYRRVYCCGHAYYHASYCGGCQEARAQQSNQRSISLEAGPGVLLKHLLRERSGEQTSTASVPRRRWKLDGFPADGSVHSGTIPCTEVFYLARTIRLNELKQNNCGRRPGALRRVTPLRRCACAGPARCGPDRPAWHAELWLLARHASCAMGGGGGGTRLGTRRLNLLPHPHEVPQAKEVAVLLVPQSPRLRVRKPVRRGPCFAEVNHPNARLLRRSVVYE